MNRILIVVLLIITGCGVGFVIDLRDSDLRDSNNIVYNSGFENGDYDYNTTPEDWIVLNKPLNKIFWDNGEKHNGEKCVKIKHPDRKISLISEAFSLNPQAVYHVKCFLKSQKNASIRQLPYCKGYTPAFRWIIWWFYQLHSTHS